MKKFLAIFCISLLLTTSISAQKVTPKEEIKDNSTSSLSNPLELEVKEEDSKPTGSTTNINLPEEEVVVVNPEQNLEEAEEGANAELEDDPELGDPENLPREDEQNTELIQPKLPQAFDWLKNSNGSFETDLFTGSATYSYPIWIPEGRKEMTPYLNLTYSSNQKNYESPIGYGWSLPTNAIFRSTRKGVDKLYIEDDFTADINRNTTELIVTDQEQGLYGAKTETSFTKYIFTDNHWIATDTKGTKYFFGINADTKQVNPDNEEEVYKWLLERIEDPNGNYITYTYIQDSGQIYPATIRYTGYEEEEGLFEVRFVLEERPYFLSYERGFRTETSLIFNEIQIYSLIDEEELIRTYELDHEVVNDAIIHLTGITIRSGENILPPINFSYYDGTEEEPTNKNLLLKEIDFPYGAVQRLIYKPSTAYRLGDDSMANGLHFVVHTVHESSVQAGPNEPWYTTSYSYEGGHYYYDQLDAYKKEYAGFHKVEVIDPVENRRKIFFHQSEFSPDNEESEVFGEFEDHISKKGKIYREEVYDDQENLYQKTIKKWDNNQLQDDDEEKERFFVYLNREVIADYDGNPSYRAKAKEMWYDGFGNIVNEIDQGEVILNGENGNYQDMGTDRITTIFSYAQNEEDYLVSYLSRIEKRDFGFRLIAQQQQYYDYLGLGQISKGNPTMQEVLVTEPDNLIRTKTTYNEYGLPISFKNPRFFETRINYEEHNLYPELITNPLLHETEVIYDLVYGVPIQITDPNNARKIVVLDEFGRVIESFISNPLNPDLNTRINHYDYQLEEYPISITEIKYPQEGIEVFARTYFDGLSRPIQVRTEAENNYVVIDTIYDERGNTKKQTLPIFQHGLIYLPLDPFALGMEYEYDTLNRQITIMSPLGIIRTEYDNWAQKVWDLNGNQKDFAFDARENLTDVWEYLDQVPFVTKYEYDALNNLIKITDALGNQKNLTYDLLCRKLTEEELHTFNDDTFGVWEYEYDANNNVISVTDARDQETNFTYDELDRIVTEDTDTLEGIEVTYTYDQGQNAIGRLSQVEFSNGSKNYTYDLLGRITRQDFIIEDEEFILQFTYDNLDNPLSVIYPNLTVVTYEYNGAGQLQRVLQNANEVVTNLDYAPTGSVVRINFSNGVETTNTYDITQAYRLINKKTKRDQEFLQNIFYNYDPVGNIISIIDQSNTDVAKNAFYQYDSLYRLVGATITESANGEDYDREYTYDILGNILTKGGLEGNYIYRGKDPETSPDTIASPHAVTSIGETEYIYDEDGNLLSNGIWEHEWDWKDRLSSSNNEEEEITMNYLYDEGKDRIFKENIEQEEQTYYVDKYYDLEQEKQKAHIYAGNTKVATLETENNNSIIIYHHEDHLTGSNVDTNEEGGIVQLLDYFPYGDTRIDDAEEGFENDYEFTGKERDEETELLYYEARYYDSNLGRFISRDSWEGDLKDPQSLNKYSYVQNNPLKYVDPSGNTFAESIALGGMFTVADGPLLIGDIIGVSIIVGAAIYQAAIIAKTVIGNLNNLKDNISPFPANRNESSPFVTPADKQNSAQIMTFPGTGSESKTTSVPANKEQKNPITTSLTGERSLPLHGDPSTTGLRWKDGKIDQARTWDKQGNPARDIDFSDNNRTVPNPHVHGWTPKTDGSYDHTSRSKDHESLQKEKGANSGS
ncbi:hypothetical protein K9M41_02415 [Candidatus Gracilibacteria bacterium]|nr:hypothetical protein [Candidatus Gracilibacteria bacterium]